jgi:anti-sigma regulatory factor (Ser/Thr protein kinase)
VAYTTRCDIAREPDDGRDGRLGALCLPMDARSVAVARRHVVDVARAWGVADDVIDLAELLCSEVVTNAVIHPTRAADAFVEVAVIRDGRRLVVECRDPSRELPRVVAVPNPLRESGRGMCLVASLAYDYGVDLADGGGKTVWFELIAWPGSGAVVSEAGTLA